MGEVGDGKMHDNHGKDVEDLVIESVHESGPIDYDEKNSDCSARAVTNHKVEIENIDILTQLSDNGEISMENKKTSVLNSYEKYEKSGNM